MTYSINSETTSWSRAKGLAQRNSRILKLKLEDALKVTQSNQPSDASITTHITTRGCFLMCPSGIAPPQLLTFHGFPLPTGQSPGHLTWHLRSSTWLLHTEPLSVCSGQRPPYSLGLRHILRLFFPAWLCRIL